jgi:hypothetical protein
MAALLLFAAVVLLWNHNRVGTNALQRATTATHIIALAFTTTTAWCLWEFPTPITQLWLFVALGAWLLTATTLFMLQARQRATLNRQRLQFGEPPHPAPLSPWSLTLRASLYSLGLCMSIALSLIIIATHAEAATGATRAQATGYIITTLGFCCIGGTTLALAQAARRRSAIQQRQELVDGIRRQLRSQYETGYDRGFVDGQKSMDPLS